MNKLKALFFSKPIRIIGIGVLAIVIFFFDNIHGYYRFKEFCEIEKNKQIISKVEPDMGWVFNEGVPTTPPSVFNLASSPHVKFVRFKDYDDKQLYDATYFGANQPAKSKFADNKAYKEFYEIKPADLSQKPVYAWKQLHEDFPNQPRTSRYGDQIIDLRTKKVVVNLTNIGYGLFDRNHTLLDAPSGNTCEWYEYLGKDSNKTLIFGE